MKTLIIYYSYTGNSKKQALLLKEKNPAADIYEVKEKHRVGMFITYLINCPKAALRKRIPIQDIEIDLAQYDRFILVTPVWNGYPAPEFNSILDKLPPKKETELYLCSGGGETNKSKARTCELIEAAGYKLLGYHDIKTT